MYEIKMWSANSNQPPEKRIKEKEPKTKKQVQVDSAATDTETECRPPDPVPEDDPKEEECDGGWHFYDKHIKAICMLT